jgi:hypothetical protein
LFSTVFLKNLQYRSIRFRFGDYDGKKINLIFVPSVFTSLSFLALNIIAENRDPVAAVCIVEYVFIFFSFPARKGEFLWRFLEHIDQDFLRNRVIARP